ncbi:hypothetical protein EV702DRAFT_1051761 [Suillus placidus]|uniref:Uncharacterized protein n=1 Tax=Suillus placidus TaxID=48579 RepID=A0A9P7CVP9_9AGAM|nr:hypothetical protein EV702DRAFT_1051761 [Suillus placidus]
MEPESLHKREIEERKPWLKAEHQPTPQLSLISTTVAAGLSPPYFLVPKEPQSKPEIPELLNLENIENAESNIQSSSLRQLIISRIQNGGDGPEVEVVLVPLHTTMGITVNSFIILDDFEVSLPIHMMHNTDILFFWLFEVSVSQTSEAATTKLQNFADLNKNILAATHIHIFEAQKYMSLTFEWGVERDLAKRGVQMKELTYSENGGFTLLSHTWCHPVMVTISMWIHPPNKRLNLKSHSSRYYVTAMCALEVVHY